MTQKIKLMSKSEAEELAYNTIYPRSDNQLLFHYLIAKVILDECEKRATEKLREVAERFYNMALSKDSASWISFDEDWKQYLKEQSLTEPPSLDNVQGFLDLTKEQYGE